MTNDKADQAREGLLDSVAGKAKEVVGAVAGKDDLVEEGQLQQAEASNRREAVAEEAIADVKRADATEELREANREATGQKAAAAAQAQREESAVEHQRAAERTEAERAAEEKEALGREAAEKHGADVAETRLREAESLEKDASSTEQDAEVERRRLQREAAVTDHQAAQLRADTDK